MAAGMASAMQGIRDEMGGGGLGLGRGGVTSA